MPQQIKGCPFRNMAQQRPGAAAAAAQTIAAVERSIGDSAPLPGEHRAVHETPVVFSKDESAKTDEAAAAAEMASTSLFDACKEGRSAVVRAWLNKGAEVDRANTWGETPLFVACQNDHREAARLLLEQGAEVDRADVDGRTPLFAACVKGQVDLARLLLGNGAEVDRAASGLMRTKGRTPLYVACANGHVAVATLLLDRGAVVDRANEDGETPLLVAKALVRASIVALLEENRGGI